jgi:hypothetical protein
MKITSFSCLKPIWTYRVRGENFGFYTFYGTRMDEDGLADVFAFQQERGSTYIRVRIVHGRCWEAEEEYIPTCRPNRESWSAGVKRVANRLLARLIRGNLGGA